jgi:TIR domain
MMMTVLRMVINCNAFQVQVIRCLTGALVMPDLTSQEDVARWLAGKPRHVAVVFAARAALRAIPALASTFGLHGRVVSKDQSATMLRVFRCAAAAWAVAAFPGSVAESAVAWASAAAGAHEIGNFAIHSARYVVEAAARLGRKPFEEMLAAFATDAGILDEGSSPVTVALSSALWPNVPDWAFDGWAELESSLLDANEDWEVWTDWYQARLKAGPADQVLEVARATIPNDVWKQGPKVVNAEIRRMFEEREIWRHGTADEIEPEAAYVAPEVPPVASVKDLERRLANLSFEEVSVIGARVALRAVPLLKLGPAEFGVAFLSMWRAISLAWAAVEYPTHSTIRARSVRAYTEASKSRVAIVRAIARATIAPAANSMTDSVTHVLAAGIESLRSAAVLSDGVAAGAAFDMVLSQDVNDFSGAPSSTAVAELPLWPGGSPPEWMTRRWNGSKRGLIGAGHGWEVWIDWYEDRLTGKIRSEGREFAYVEVPDDLWADGPARVNRWILERVEAESGAAPSWDFFLSYSNDDLAFARWIEGVLSGVGFRVFAQFNNMPPGSNFVREMQRGLAQSARLIALLSPAYQRSDHCQAEWSAAYNVDPGGQKRKLVPF